MNFSYFLCKGFYHRNVLKMTEKLMKLTETDCITICIQLHYQ